MQKFIFSIAAILLFACTGTSNPPISAPTPVAAPKEAVVVDNPQIPEKQEQKATEKVIKGKNKAKKPVSQISNQGKKEQAPALLESIVKVEPSPVAPVLEIPQTAPVPGIPKHEAWEALLQKHVSAEGKVNYQGLKSEKEALDAYCMALGAAIPDEGWSKSEQMAYWINAYNAFTVKLIVDNYPTASILRFDGGKTWDVKRIKLGDKKYSLNQIENEILRPVFKDPRVHFAINCAAKSCPPLYSHAFTADNLEEALQARTKAFINDKKYNQLSGDKAQISKIFEWYAVDFGEIHAFLNQYAAVAIKKSAVIKYEEYDWGLND